MKNELKTLKDIVLMESPLNGKVGEAYKYNARDLVIRELMRRECKKEAIKWIKEDLDWIGSTGAEKGLIMRWMDRFSITEEDLNGA